MVFIIFFFTVIRNYYLVKPSGRCLSYVKPKIRNFARPRFLYPTTDELYHIVQW